MNEHAPRSSNYPRKDFVKARHPAQPAKPKGHDAYLKMLQDKKVRIHQIALANGDLSNVVITDRDKFTITVRRVGILGMDAASFVIYKHAIETIEVLDSDIPGEK